MVSVQSNRYNEFRAEFGSAIVLLAKTKENGKLRSSFIDLFACFALLFRSICPLEVYRDK